MNNRIKLVIEALEDLEINSSDTRFEMARIIAIEELKKILNSDWILCSERLPDVFDYVFVTSNAGGRTIAHRMPNQTNWYDLHSTVVETGVLAWQPLPEPYKEIKNNKTCTVCGEKIEEWQTVCEICKMDCYQ